MGPGKLRIPHKHPVTLQGKGILGECWSSSMATGASQTRPTLCHHPGPENPGSNWMVWKSCSFPWRSWFAPPWGLVLPLHRELLQLDACLQHQKHVGFHFPQFEWWKWHTFVSVFKYEILYSRRYFFKLPLPCPVPQGILRTLIDIPIHPPSNVPLTPPNLAQRHWWKMLRVIPLVLPLPLLSRG